MQIEREKKNMMKILKNEAGGCKERTHGVLLAGRGPPGHAAARGDLAGHGDEPAGDLMLPAVRFHRDGVRRRRKCN